MTTINQQISDIKDTQNLLYRLQADKLANDLNNAIHSLKILIKTYGNPNSENIIISLSPEQYKKYLEFLTTI